MDINELPALTRLLEDKVENIQDLESLKEEVTSAQHQDRNLQLTIVSPEGTETPKEALLKLENQQTVNNGVKLQVLFLKNLKEYHSTTLYSETQSATLATDFSSKMGNYLKDHPLILSYSPLISFQHSTPLLYDDTRIYNLRGNETIQVTELTAFNKGWIYGMILFRETDDIENYISSLHIKRGIDARNVTALGTMKYIVDNLSGMSVASTVKHFTPGSKIWINIKDLPWDPTKLVAARRNLEEEESKHNIFEKVGFFLSEKLAKLSSQKVKEQVRKLQTAPEDRDLQVTDFEEVVFNETIFWENTLPNPNVTEYTFFYIATDQRTNDWTQHTAVKKIQFSFYGFVDYNKQTLINSIQVIFAILGLNFLLR